MLGILTAGGLLVGLLHGAPGAIELEWDGPDGCGEQAFVRQLARYLPDGAAEQAEAEIAVTVVEQGAGFHLTFELSRARVRVHREFDAERCATVSEAAAFVAAVTIDPSVMDRLDAAEPEPSPEPSPEPELEEAAEPEPSPEPESQPSPEPRRWALRAASGPSGLSLPQLGALARVGGELVGRRVRLGALATYRSPGEVRSSVLPGAGGRLSLWALGARGCWVPRARALSFPLCVGAEGGVVVGRGFGFSGARTSVLAWVAVNPAAELVWSVHPRLSLVAAFEPAVVVLRHTFVIEGLGPVHSLGPVELRGLLGVEIVLGPREHSRNSR